MLATSTVQRLSKMNPPNQQTQFGTPLPHFKMPDSVKITLILEDQDLHIGQLVVFILDHTPENLGEIHLYIMPKAVLGQCPEIVTGDTVRMKTRHPIDH